MFEKTKTLARDVLRLSGPDTIPLLQGILTSNIADLAVGEAQHSALLTPQGKIVDTMFLVRTEDQTLFVDVMRGRGEGLLKRLKLYRLRAKMDLDDVSSDHVMSVGPPPSNPLYVVADPRLDGLPSRCLAPRSFVPDTMTEGDGAYTDLEISMGVPAFGTAYLETDAFPLGVNLDLLNGIDHKKGCFVGQEVASRMFRKGDIRKRTWHVAGSGVSPCDELTVNGQNVAMVSAATETAGLAVVRLDRLGDVTEAQATTPSGETVILKKPSYLL